MIHKLSSSQSSGKTCPCLDGIGNSTTCTFKRRRQRRPWEFVVLFATLVIRHEARATQRSEFSQARMLDVVPVSRGGGIAANVDDNANDRPFRVSQVEKSTRNTETKRKASRIWPGLFQFADDIKAEVSSGASTECLGFSFRGGQSGSDSDHDDSEERSVDQTQEDETAESAGKEKKSSLLWPGLFQLADDIKSEVSSGADIDLLGSTASFESGRGGALVKPKPRRFSQFLRPLDITRVAPLESRLLNDGDILNWKTSSAEEIKNSNSGTVAYARSIWASTWEEQIPDEEMGTTMMQKASSMAEREESEHAEKESEESDETFDEMNSVNQRKSEAKATESKELKRTSSNESDEGTDIEAAETKKHKGKKKKSKKSRSDAGELALTIDNKRPLPKPSIELQRPEVSDSKTPKVVEVIDAEDEDEKQLGQELTSNDTEERETKDKEISFISSGYWNIIDNTLTLGYASSHPEWRLSPRLRFVRKATARITGLHGFVSGKYRSDSTLTLPAREDSVLRRRIDAIDRARKNLDRLAAITASKKKKRRWFGVRTPETAFLQLESGETHREKTEEEIFEEKRRKERVKEIDRQIQENQRRLFELACEKDVLQRRPNPLWNYTVDNTPDRGRNPNASDVSESLVTASRAFNFPPKDLVDDYLEMLFSSGRIVKMNHTDLWQKNGEEDDDEDELSSPYGRDMVRKKNTANAESQSGSWFLRNGLGEKIGETAESAAYKAICNSVMSVLARSLSGLHGLNVMAFSDIRLFMEQTPNLPPLAAAGTGKSNTYGQETIHEVVRRGARKAHKRRNIRRRSNDDAFIQRDAVVETLLSQCHIAAPLFKLFPLAWQRAILSNIITLVTAIVTDFCEGVEFQILGHRLSFSFTPITEEDMLRGLMNDSFNSEHRANPEQFEAAVIATAANVGGNLKFLDRWHERALGGGLLRTQIATLIARLVLTIVDDILHGAKMNLWASHAGGPRLMAGLEYRTTPTYMGDAN